MIENMHYTLMYCAEHHHGCMVQGWHEAIPDGFSLLNSPYPNETSKTPKRMQTVMRILIKSCP